MLDSLFQFMVLSCGTSSVLADKSGPAYFWEPRVIDEVEVHSAKATPVINTVSEVLLCDMKYFIKLSLKPVR